MACPGKAGLKVPPTQLVEWPAEGDRGDEATYDRWRAEYGGLRLDQVRRLKQLEQEDRRLRRAVSDLTLERLILEEAASENW